MRRNCRTYLTQISIRFASNYGRSAHTRCRKERAPEESTSHRATYLLIFLCPKTFVEKCHISACDVSSYLFAPTKLFANNITSLALPPREGTWGEQISPCYASFYFFARKKHFWRKKKSRRGSKKAKKLPNLLDSDIITFCFKNIDSNNVFNRFWIQIIEKAALVKTSGKHTWKAKKHYRYERRIDSDMDTSSSQSIHCVDALIRIWIRILEKNNNYMNSL